MNKVRASVQRILSVMLAAAMVATAVPQTGMYAFAQEEKTDIEQVVPVNEKGTEALDDEGIVPSDEGENQDGVEDENTPSDEEHVDADAPVEDDDADDNVSDDADVTDSEDEENLAMEEEVLYASPEDDEADVMPLEDEGEDGEPDVTEENVVTIPVSGDHFTIQDTNNATYDAGNLKITLPKEGTSYTATFKVVPEEDEDGNPYVIRNIQTINSSGRSGSLSLDVKSGSSGSITFDKSAITGECKLTIAMKKTGTFADVAGISGGITVTTVKKEDRTWTFTYAKDTFEDVKVQKNIIGSDNEDIIINGEGNTYTASISNDTFVVLLVQPKNEGTIPYVVQDKGEEDYEYKYEYDETQGDYYVFHIGRSFRDTTIDVDVSEACSVTFQSDWEETYIEFADTLKEVELNTPYMVRKGNPIRFNVDVSVNIGDIEVRANGVLLEKYYDEENDESYYEYTPTADTTITIGVVPHEIPLEYDDDAVTDVQISWDYGEEWSEVDKSIVFSDFENDWPTLKFKLAEGVRLKGINLSYYDDDEPYFIEASDIELGEDGYYVFSEALSGYMKVTIITERYRTIDLYIRGVNVYNVNVWYDEEGGQPNYNRSSYPFVDETDGMTVKHSVDVSSDEPYYFAVSKYYRLGYGIFVSTTGDERGRIEPIYKEADNYNYYKVDPSEPINTLYVLAETHVIPIKDDYGVIDKLEVAGNDPDITTFNQDRNEVEILREDSITVRFLPKEAAKEAQIGAYYVLRESVFDENGEEYYENRKYSIEDLTKEDDGYYSFSNYVDVDVVEFGITSDKSFNTESQIVLEYETAAIKEIKAWVSGKTVKANQVNDMDNGRTEELYLVSTDKTIDFDITTNSSHTIVKETFSQGGSITEADVAAGTTRYTKSVDAASNARLSIDTKDTTELPSIEVKVYEIIGDGLGAELENTSQKSSATGLNVGYDAKKDKKYAISVYTYGTQIPAENITKSFNSYAEVIADQDKQNPNNVEIKIKDNANAGTTATANLTVDVPAGESKTERKKVNIVFSVKGDIEKIKLPKAEYDENGKGVLTQSVDSLKKFTVNIMDPSKTNTNFSISDVDIDTLGMEFKRSTGVAEEDLKAELEIVKTRYVRVIVEIGPDADIDKTLGTIKFYNKDYAPGDDKYYIEGGDIDIVASRPTRLEGTTPNPTVSYVDDISITLDVPSPSPDDVEVPYTGKQYFKVVVTPKGENANEPTIVAATAKPFYFERQIPEDISDEDAEEAVYEKITQKLSVRVDSEDRRGTITEKDVCDFDVKVSIVQTNGTETEKDLIENTVKVLFSSQEASVPTVTTKASSFETKLTLKKGKTTIYTTQQNVVAATTKFTATTNNRSVTVQDTTAVSDEEKLTVRFEDDQILVSASAKTSLGKHTIAVTPYGPPTMYQPTSTLTVKVQKGIEEIVLTSPTYVFKPVNKAASLQVKVSYNTTNNTDGVQPKTKKVKWSIVDKNGDAFDPEYDEDICKYVTVNASGKVSINKKLDTDDIDYSFYVKATANDYNGNTVTGMSEEITISADGLIYSTLALVKQEGARYKVLATDVSTKQTAVSLTTAELKGTMLVALGNSVEADDMISIDKAIFTDNLTVKSSNKIVTLTPADQEIQVGVPNPKPVKNVKLTVTLADGSKQSKVLKLTVKAAEPNKLRLSIRPSGNSKALNDVNDKTKYKDDAYLHFDGTVNTKLTLSVMQGENDDAAFESLVAYTNHTVKITGGKLLVSDVAAGEYTAIVTGETATVTLKNTAKNVTETYTITNDNYSTEKAPKVSITSGTSKSIWSGDPDEDKEAVRTLAYTLGGNNYPWTGKSVLVELSAADATAVKNKEKYDALWNAYTDKNKPVPVEGDSFKLNFNKDNIPAGSYKLTLTFGTAESGTIEADAKPVTITVKAAAPKKTTGSYKAETSYKIAAKPGEKVPFTKKSEKAVSKDIVYNDILGSNVQGAVYIELLASNIKGKSNNFLNYFELGYEKDDEGVITESYLKLKDQDKLTPEQSKNIEQRSIDKNDLTGYVTYTVSYGEDGYGHPIKTETKTVKITVKLVAPPTN